MAKVLVINGPNLNMLGIREPGVYGKTTLPEINATISRRAAELGVAVEFYQSNSEGALIDRIHAGSGEVDVIILNPGAYTHTSYALRDAITAVGIPTIEVHLSNIHAREPFRDRSVISPVVSGIIAGLGPRGYLLALEAASTLISH